MGSDCIVEPGANVQEGCILGNRTSIGPNCMVGPQCVFKGNNMMGPNVHIYTINHIYDESNHKFSGITDPIPVTELLYCPALQSEIMLLSGLEALLQKIFPMVLWLLEIHVL